MTARPSKDARKLAKVVAEALDIPLPADYSEAGREEHRELLERRTYSLRRALSTFADHPVTLDQALAWAAETIEEYPVTYAPRVEDGGPT